jgi:hypothetical protein
MSDEPRALVTTWVPGGAIDAAIGAAMRAVSAATGFTPRRFPWGDTGMVEELLRGNGASATFEEGAVSFSGSSPEEYFAEVQAFHPMHVSTRALLERAGTYDTVREQMLAALREGNKDPSAFRVTSRYRIVRIERD